MNKEAIIEDLLSFSSKIRYVALYTDDDLLFKQKEEASNNSEAGTDRFEELLVNPTLLTLAKQRGNIDCGGLRFLVVGYGNFYQLVKGLSNGHLSICIEKSSDLNKLPEEIFTFTSDKYPELL